VFSYFVALNFDEIRRNAAEQSISLSEIAIIYDGISDEQFEALNRQGLVVSGDGESGKCVGRFTNDGEVLFPDMATGVLYLGA
jgi:hypothetical protein